MENLLQNLIIGISWGIAFIALAASYAIIKAVRYKYPTRDGKDVPEKAEKRLMQRLDQLERQLADTQTIMLSLDEKLIEPQLPAAHAPARPLED